MKKHINNKVYDTEKARKVAEYRNPGTFEDPAHYEETLYQKKTGEYFLAGTGGPNTKYVDRSEPDCYFGTTTIIPLSYGEAIAWGQKSMKPDIYEAEFGEAAEDESRIRVNISVKVQTIEKAKKEAAKRGCTVSALIEELIENFV